MSEAIVDKSSLDFDPDALRDKYREERDKRLRTDANQQYIEVKGDFSHYVDDPYLTESIKREPLTDETDVIIVGGGFGGLLMGARLRNAGIKDLRIIEKGGDFGGTWYWNRYPGAACDIESYIYLPLLEELNFMPVEKYTRAPEILAHCRTIGEHFNLYDKACFQTEVTELHWEEAISRWIVETNRGDKMQSAQAARHSRHRQLQRPQLPHQSLGLRLHGRHRTRQSGQTERQADRHHRHRGNGRSVRAAPRRRRQGTLRVPAHSIIHRRPRQLPDRSGMGEEPGARLAERAHGELQRAGLRWLSG
jgi:glycine/D-amino acid oxidase-like deaminating enzyme